MENPEPNQLPEVDSLPDGFVESTSEILAPKTPISEQEKPLQPDCKDDLVSSQFGANERQELITLPVPLSEAEDFDGSSDSVEGKLVGPKSGILVSEAGECGEVKEVKGECESTDTCTEGGSETNLTTLKGTSSSESVDLLKNKKPETTETKRKTAKRTFKSEKEFLEFSLKYQQVLAERDAAIAVRDKLESLCRELQRQNKMLMRERLRKQLEKTKNQKEKLESLCRSLQAERKQSSAATNGSNSLADQM